MKSIERKVFELLKASLFTDEPVELAEWQSVFTEMKKQSVAALPGDWLKSHPVAPEWNKFCSFQQGQWIRVMHAQEELLALLEANNVSSAIIKGAASAMYYPHPSLRSMGDVDVLVKRVDISRAAEVLEANGYSLTSEKRIDYHHYNYSKDGISIELHRRLGIVDDKDEELLALFEHGIDERIWITTEAFCFPVLHAALNGLVLIFHVNQHLREGLGLRQIIDWMMYVNQLSADEWNELLPLLRKTGMEKLALTTTAVKAGL